MKYIIINIIFIVVGCNKPKSCTHSTNRVFQNPIFRKVYLFNLSPICKIILFLVEISILPISTSSFSIEKTALKAVFFQS